MCTWFSASWRRFRYDRKCQFSCIYNPQITISPTSLFSATFNGNRVKNHPKPWTCPLKTRVGLCVYYAVIDRPTEKRATDCCVQAAKKGYFFPTVSTQKAGFCTDLKFLRLLGSRDAFFRRGLTMARFIESGTESVERQSLTIIS